MAEVQKRHIDEDDLSRLLNAFLELNVAAQFLHLYGIDVFYDKSEGFKRVDGRSFTNEQKSWLHGGIYVRNLLSEFSTQAQAKYDLPIPARKVENNGRNKD